jgi:hypothetical protein
MATDRPRIVDLMVKYAQRESLTLEEMIRLKRYWEKSPQHAKLAEEFGDPHWVVKMMKAMDKAPQELWDEMSGRLDELGAPRLEKEKLSEGSEDVGFPERKGRSWYAVLPLVIILLCGITVTWKLDYQRRLARLKVLNAPTHAKTWAASVVLTSSASKGSVNICDMDVGWNFYESGKRVLRKVDSNSLTYASETETPNGEWNEVKVGSSSGPFHLGMPNGSSIWLAPGTTIRFPLKGQGRYDSLEFSGICYFDLPSDSSRPYRISLSGRRSLITSGGVFMVESPKDRSKTFVMAVSALQLYTGTFQKITMSGNDKVDLGKDSLSTSKLGDADSSFRWLKGSFAFHFNSTPLRVALLQVADWYGYSIDNPDGIEGTPVTDDIRRQGSGDLTIRTIGSLQLNYACVTIQGKSILVRPYNKFRKLSK